MIIVKSKKVLRTNFSTGKKVNSTATIFYVTYTDGKGILLSITKRHYENKQDCFKSILHNAKNHHGCTHVFFYDMTGKCPKKYMWQLSTNEKIKVDTGFEDSSMSS